VSRPLWQQLEDYLFDVDAQGVNFNARELAQVFDVPTSRATAMIQSHLHAQIRPRSQTRFFLRRVEGRTSAAMWHVGIRAIDVRGAAAQTADDFRCRMRRYLVPTMHQYGVRNKRAVPAAQAMTELFAASLRVLSTTFDD